MSPDASAQPPAATPAKRCLFLRAAGYATPIAAIAALLLIYAIAPGFYVTYVLEYWMRESQAVEAVTVASAFAGSVLMFIAAWNLWRLGPGGLSAAGVDLSGLTGPAFSRGRGGAILIAVVALAAFFFGGEEVNWGESLATWGVPEYEKHAAGETVRNIHNTVEGFSVQSLGTLFLIAVFFGLPLLWWIGRRRPALGRRIADWMPAIATGPAVFCMAVALLWSRGKSIYVSANPRVRDIAGDREAWLGVVEQIKSGTVTAEPAVVHYVGFVDQINEQKEMLIAVALLMYGLGCLAAARRLGK